MKTESDYGNRLNMERNDYSDNELSRYLKEISQYPLITNEREIELAKLMSGPKRKMAREELIKANLRLVVKFANDYHNRTGAPIMDLIGAGNIGLITAVDKYNPVKFKNRFSTFAVSWIKRHIFITLHDYSNLLHVPINLSNRARRYSKLDEIKDHESLIKLNVSKKELSRMESSKAKILFLDKTMDGREYNKKLYEKDVTLNDIIPDNITKSPDVNVYNNELRVVVAEVLATLNPKERDILKARFFGDKKENLHKIGKRYNCTGEAIRQKMGKALKSFRIKLRQKVGIEELHRLENCHG